MTRAKISEYSATANDNTDVNGINIAEGCPPSSMNNMGREIMAALKRFQVGSDGDGVTVGGSLVVSGSTSVNTFNVDVISEKTSAAGVTVDGVLLKDSQVSTDQINEKTSATGVTIDGVLLKDSGVVTGAGTVSAPVYSTTGDLNTGIFFPAADTIAFAEGGAEAMRIDSSGNVGVGTSSPTFSGFGSSTGGIQVTNGTNAAIRINGNTGGDFFLVSGSSQHWLYATGAVPMSFSTNGSERARITSDGYFLVHGLGTASDGNERLQVHRDGAPAASFARQQDGTIVNFRTGGTSGAIHGTISISGVTTSYNAFSGAHWSQLQQGRGYNPDIPRGTVMSTIGEMAEWKSVEWTETIEHEATEEKETWTESISHRESYLGDLPVGSTFEEDGFTKAVVDDGNERLPKVKISDVVGDKAVYGVFQTWDEVEDMLVTSLGAFVVRIAAGVTVEIGDLLESNGDGCAKVQDDDVIRSKTIAKVISTTPTAIYEDGSYTVPAVIYCG